MRGLDGDGKVGGSNETEGRAPARSTTCGNMSLRLKARVSMTMACFKDGGRLVKNQTSDLKPQTSHPLLFQEQSIG
jgi:hypothetical protein